MLLYPALASATSRATPASAVGSVSSELWTIVRTAGGGGSLVRFGAGPLSMGMAGAAAGTASAPATTQAATRRRVSMGRTSWGVTGTVSEDLLGGAACPFAVRRIVLRGVAP